MEEAGIPLKSFYKPIITPIPKPHKKRTEKENRKPVSLVDLDIKNSMKYWQIGWSNAQKEFHVDHDRWDLF